jgi:uncharacterized protein YbjT (DUF2867 family)
MFTVLHFGATGLIGESFLKIADQKKQLPKIIVLARRSLPSVSNSNIIEQHIINFNLPDDLSSIPPADIIVCTIGTTIRKAGSQEAFRKVDYDIPLEIARSMFLKGTRYFVLVSSVGADTTSKMFYTKVKGEVERDISKIPFAGIHILRPSLLLGKREEQRFGEKLGQSLAGIYSVFLPDRFKPISAEAVASKIHSICLNPGDGIHVYEGKDFYF